jgi:hypothetical protein
MYIRVKMTRDKNTAKPGRYVLEQDLQCDLNPRRTARILRAVDRSKIRLPFDGDDLARIARGRICQVFDLKLLDRHALHDNILNRLVTRIRL